MAAQTYEVEIKALLGEAERAEALRRAMQETDPTCTLRSKNKQLNHYFEGNSLQDLSDKAAKHLTKEAKEKLNELAARARDFSVRTRDKDGKVYLVVKASVDDTTSENGIARMEFEEGVKLSLEELDQLVVESGFDVQAKWSREREEYVCRGTNVTLDRNAGYGWLAEFERIVNDEKELRDAEHDLRNLMQMLDVTELPQDRLARMFDYYNKHWLEYYGTEKVFVIE